MNYEGVHAGYIKISKRDSDGVAFVLKRSGTLGGVVKAIAILVVGAVIGGFLGSLIGFLLGSGMGMTIALIGIFAILLPTLILRRMRFNMAVTANKEAVTVGKHSYLKDDWGGFVIKEKETLNLPNQVQYDHFDIFIRNRGVDYATGFNFDAHGQSAEVINQMNLLVNEALGKATKGKLSKQPDQDEWV